MAKIFQAPADVQIPVIDFGKTTNVDWQKADDKYIADVKEHIKKLGYDEPETGEIIDFPVADGKALYMVITCKPLMLVHLPLGDAWHFEYAKNLTAKDVRQKIAGRKALDKLFADNKAKQAEKK